MRVADPTGFPAVGCAQAGSTDSLGGAGVGVIRGIRSSGGSTVRSRIIAASTAVVVAGVILFGGVSAATATPATSPEPSPEPSAQVLAPLLEELVASGADPASPDTATALSLAPAGPGSLQTDAQDRIVVTATFQGAVDAARIEAVAALGEVRAVSPFVPKVTVAVAPGALPALAAIDGVTGVAADLAASTGSSSLAASTGASGTPAAVPTTPAGCRSVPVDVDAGLNSAAARERFGVDGTGVTVGIMSDSFDTNASALTTWATDVSLGVLPGPGNPCGYTQPVELVGATQPVGTDEGRGMAQLVHGVAPGARLMFATGTASTSTFSASVKALVDAGADVIVDDINLWYAEPMFQDGEIGLAIDYATAHGVLYVSAADNFNEFSYYQPDYAYAVGGWQSSVYSPTGCPAGIAEAVGSTDIDCHNFGTAAEPDATNNIIGANTTASTPSFSSVLNWAEPVGDVHGNLIVALIDHSTQEVLLTGSRTDNDLPISSYSGALPTTTTGSGTPTSLGEYEVVVVRQLDGYEPVLPAFKFIFPNDEPGTVQGVEYYQNTETVTVGPTIFGHTADADVLSVGASDWRDLVYNESFSSVGPVTHLFEPVRADGTPAARFAAPVIRSKPDITSLDGAQTSFFEPPVAADGNYYFYGTSAASPNAAAVAALALQYSPQSSADDVKRAMTSTAGAMKNPYPNLTDANVYGAGLLNAEATLAALPAAPIPAPAPAAAGTGSTTLAATGDPVSPAVSAGVLALLALAAGAGALVVRRRIRMSQN